MQTNHFINDPNALVLSALRSLSLTNPNITVNLEQKIAYASSDKSGQVSLVSGGGSGHEPSFTGFVGAGFLTAAVAGTIFASPSSRQVLEAINGVPSMKGILVIVMNYTGDVMNFGVAIEKAKAQNPDKQIEMLVVGDDVGVPRSKAGKVGRRGIAGTVLVQKILGAMSGSGYALEDIKKVGRLVCENLASVGVSLGRVHVPGQSKEQSLETVIGPDEMELGMGIHNETGSGRISGSDAQLTNLVSEMLRQILDTNDVERSFIPAHKEMILLVNNLGSVSPLEFAAITGEIVQQLQVKYKKMLSRVYCGTFMTSLDGRGFSISLLNEIGIGLRESLLDLLDAPSDVPGWHTVSRPLFEDRVSPTNRGMNVDALPTMSRIELTCDLRLTIERLVGGLKSVIASEAEITEYDTVVGDGDCGTTLKRGAQGILDLISKTQPDTIVNLLEQITSAVETTMDGTSGALYAIFSNSLTSFFKQRANLPGNADLKFWTEGLTCALNALRRYTPASVGDRTMMDALIPFIETLKSTSDLPLAVRAASKGADNTKYLQPSLGRTVYIGAQERWLGKVPDPGAWGLSKFLTGLASV